MQAWDQRLGLRTIASRVSPASNRVQGLGVLVVALWVVAATFLQLMRERGVPVWDSIWAEDGRNFLGEALDRPFLSTLFDPHASYIQLAPRIVGGVAAALPLDRAAMVFAAGSALVVALLSAYVYFASSGILRSQWARLTLAALVVVLPATLNETSANATNLHWYLIFACFWVFLAPSRSLPAVAANAAVGLSAALSNPLTGLFLPLALLRAATGETWRERAPSVVFFAALTLQLLLGPLREPTHAFFEVSFVDIPGIYGLRVAGSLLVGDRFLDDLWIPWGLAFAYSSLAVVVAVAAYGTTKGDLRERFYVVVALGYSALFLAVPLTLRGTEHLLDREGFSLNGSRYMVVPILFLVVVFLLVLDRRDPRVAGTSWRDIQGAFVIYTVTIVLLNYSNPSVRTQAPSWQATLAAARRACAGGSSDAGQHGGRPVASGVEQRDGRVVIPVAPNVEPNEFALRTTCDRIG